MSDTIHAAAINDPGLAAIRAQVSLQDARIPYLLLPVKIETRFMRVDRPLVKPDVFTDVLEDLLGLEAYMGFEPAQTPQHEVLGRFKKIADRTRSLASKAAGLQQLDGNAREALLRQVQVLTKSNQDLGAAIGKLSAVAEVPTIRELRGLRTSTDEGLKTLQAIIASIGPAAPAGDTLLQPLENIVKALQDLVARDLSALDRREKRHLFIFIDERQAAIEAGIKEMRLTIATNTAAPESQLKKLDALTVQLQPLSGRAKDNIGRLQSRYKALVYQAQQDGLTRKLALLQEQIHTRLRPKLQLMLEVPRVNARDLLIAMNELNAFLKKSAARPFAAYNEIMASRKVLYKKLHGLREGTAKVIVGDEKEFSAMQQTWAEVDAGLELFLQKIDAFNTTDQAEKAELGATIHHLSEEWRKPLAEIKSTAKGAAVRINNKVLDKALEAYRQVLVRLHALNDKITAAPEQAADLVREAEAFGQALPALAQQLVFLPRQAHRQLLEAARALEKTMGGLPAGVPAESAGAPAPTNIGSQIRQAMEARAALFPLGAPATERRPLVLAAQTITRDELWVRIYPDDIAVHTHEELLTQAEADSGKAYWLETMAAGDDADLKLAAWRAITASYGSQRAAWIVRTMQPVSGGTRARDTLLQASRTTLATHQELEKLYSLLNQPVPHQAPFTLLGQAYPVLVNIGEKLKTVKKENAVLLLKTQHWLLKIQSLLNQMVKQVNAMPEGLRLQAQPGLQLMKEFLTQFNRLPQTLQGIGKVSSRDLIREQAAADMFPQVALKAAAWTQAPHSRVMPDQFVVLTMRNGAYRHVQVTKAVPAPLVVGVHPSMVENGAFQYDADKNLTIDDSIKWLTDFNEAVSKGMALSITLEEEDVAQGFDKIMVLGVKNSTPEEAKKLVEDLIDNHHYVPEGASFLPVGTATNNTETAASGYRKIEEDAALSFAVERNSELPLNPVADPAFPTDGERLAQGLGIDMAVLRHLDYSDRTELSEALTLNKALFPGTLGNFMEEGLDSLFTRDNIRHTKAFFTSYVSGRGFLPALRVGTQPYGILPVTAFSRYSATANDAALPVLTKEDFNNPASLQDELQVRYDIRLKQLLALLDNLWTDIRTSKVLHAGNTDPLDPQAHFMGMLGLHAVSEEYFYRYGVNVAARQGNEAITIQFKAEDAWSPTQVAEAFGNQVFSGYYYQSDTYTDEQIPFTDPLAFLNSKWNRINTQFAKARVFSMRHLQDQSQVLGDKIDNTGLAETPAAAANPNAGTPEEQFEARQQLPYFIDWLLDQNPWEVHAENKFSAPTPTGLTSGMPSKSLLFLLLRHSVLSAYADAILNILEAEGLTDQKTIKKMGSPGFYYQRFAADFTYVTKWTYLFSKIARLNGVLNFEMNKANSFYVYMNSLGANGYLNRYLSPESPHVFNNYANHAAHQRFVEELNETKAAVRRLKDLPTQRLERLLREHLDLCTYRLDAWRLGLVNKRLQENRQSHQSGLYLGAYGWVEDLRKGGERKPATHIPPELWQTGDEPVFTDADNLGFIHTPSLNHAVAAAILRAGFHANKATDEVDNLLSVNLSSERVRTALNLITGMRSGQEAGALLGYQFERGLHERYAHLPLELDQYIYDFREAFPLALPVNEEVNLGEAAFTQVVNGMELLETAQDFVASKGGPPHPGDSLYQSLKAFEADWWAAVNHANLLAATAAQKDAMLKEIDRMADAFDALGDLCVSESIYQVTKGNYVRSAAIMDLLAKGDVPVEIELAHTPRTGTVVTHKVALLPQVVAGIDQALTGTLKPLTGSALAAAVLAAAAAAAGWTAPFTPRALAEPTLNKWAGELIGDPAHIKCGVTYTAGTVAGSLTVTLAGLEVQPLDVLHLFGTGPLDGGAELNARVAALARKTVALPADFSGTADDLVVHIKYTERFPDWGPDDFSLYEKAGYIQAIRELITNSAPVAADDLLLPGQEEVPAAQVRNLQPEELLLRMTNLRARLQLVHDAFSTFFSTEISLANATGHTFTLEQVDGLRALLQQALAFGIPGTVPDAVVGYGDSTGLALLQAADGAAKAMATRLAQAQADMAAGSDAGLSPEVRVNALVEAGKKILGRAFVALPHFRLRNAAELVAQQNLPSSQGLLRAAGAFAMEEWSQGIARVRHRMSVLETIDMWAANFGAPLAAKVPFQFPFPLAADGTALDHWLGIAFPPGYEPAEDKLSLVLLNAAALTTAPDANKAGLLVDEWVEIIPHAAETTGITFNYDQPDAKAPNTLLLAVAPQPGGRWSWDDLAQTLPDTLELAKNRAVEPEQLEDTVFGQILPALLTEVVPPQLLPADGDNSGDAQDNPLGLQVVTDFGVVNDTYQPEEV